MVAEEIRRAAQAAPLARLCEVTSALWKAFGAGGVTEAEAEEISTLIDARRAVDRVRHFGDLSPAAKTIATSATVLRRPRRPPVRSVAVERRRRWAAAGRMPPSIAAHFTTGEQATLAVVAVEVVKRKACTMAIGAIAALAGVSESTAKRALRHARAIGLLHIRERRLSRYRNDTNVLTIISREWTSWLELRRSGGGGQSGPGTNTRGLRREDGAGRVALARGGCDSHKLHSGTRLGNPSKHSEGVRRAGG